MPAKSKAQQKLFAIADHDPSALKSKNKSLAKLSKKTLHEFAATPSKSLPEHTKSQKTRARYADTLKGHK